MEWVALSSSSSTQSCPRIISIRIDDPWHNVVRNLRQGAYLYILIVYKSSSWFISHSRSEAFFSRLQNRGGQNLAGCGNFSTACSFYCTACSFYCTADARSDSENLQKFLKKWLFWTYFVPIISKPI